MDADALSSTSHHRKAHKSNSLVSKSGSAYRWADRRIRTRRLPLLNRVLWGQSLPVLHVGPERGDGRPHCLGASASCVAASVYEDGYRQRAPARTLTGRPYVQIQTVF